MIKITNSNNKFVFVIKKSKGNTSMIIFQNVQQKHVWFGFFFFLPRFLLGTIFPEQTFCFRVHFFFSYKNVALKSFYKSEIHPFPLMLM
jgi:hypothetical protein